MVPTARPKINLLKSRRSAHAGCRAVRDSTLVAWYRSLTHLAREGRMTVTIGAGIAGCTRRRGRRVAARGGSAAGGDAGDRVAYGVSAAEWAGPMAGFRRGLSETGFVEGRNVAITPGRRSV